MSNGTQSTFVGCSDEIRAPHLLYMCDFPPALAAGGAALIARLLDGYPPDRLVTVVGSTYTKQFSSFPRWGHRGRSVTVPTSTKSGPRGIGRVKELVDWLLTPIWVALGVFLVRRHKSDVVLTVTHGHLFAAATLTALITGIPLVVILHDDWVDGIARGRLLPRSLAAPLFGFVMRASARVFAVSEEMCNRVEQEYGVRPDLQLPSTVRRVNPVPPRRGGDHPYRIAYAGSISPSVADGLRLLLGAVQESEPHLGNRTGEVHLFNPPLSADAIESMNLNHHLLTFRGWVGSEELQSALSGFDALFLPSSFDDDHRSFTQLSFPSKLADYLAVGRPILILGPPDSTVVRYAREHGFAVIVDRHSARALADAVKTLAVSESTSEELSRKALDTFEANHNVLRQREEFWGMLLSLVAGQ